MKLVIKEQITCKTVVTHLKGRFDATTTQTARMRFELLMSAGIVNFVIDLSEVLFLDSAGLSMLVFLYKRAQAINGQLKLIRPKRELTWQTFTMTGFDTFFDITDTVEAAKQSLMNKNMHPHP